MRQSHRKIRGLLSITTSLSLMMPFLPAAAQAQDAGTPPSRVGQIADLSGQVSFNGSGSGGWAAAALNYPVAQGDSLYTGDDGQAAIALNASKISLNSNTELQITELSDAELAATAAQGEAYFAIDDLEPGQNFAISTPVGTVTIAEDGQYDVITGDANDPTVVTVLSGSASVSAPGVAVQVQAGQDAVLNGESQTTVQLGQAQPDDFARRLYAENSAPPPSYAPPVVAQMTGAYELSNYGDWDQNPQYGAVWYPQVDPSWAPYREGHWAYIAPWGWTWVDNEPWGFAPFHYGRWIDVGGRWGWVPAGAYQEGGDYGPDYQPVYAPAVVTFFGLAAGIGITAAILSSGSVGWVPLGPGEAFHPYYHASPAYIRQINRVNVRNFTEINEHTTNNYSNFADRRGATFVPAAAMSHGESVARYNHMPASSELASVRPLDTSEVSTLPRAAGPLAAERPGIAPHPSAFAQRRDIPPAIVSHQPIENGANGDFRPATETARPAFSGTNPGFHAPPPPPGEGEHLNTLSAPNFRPESPNRPEISGAQFGTSRPVDNQAGHPEGESHTQPFHPETPTRPSEPEVFHPEETHPFHPDEQQARPEEQQQFHPQVQQFHPQMQEQFHPQEMQRPEQHFEQHAEAPRPPAQHAGGGDDRHKPQ